MKPVRSRRSVMDTKKCESAQAFTLEGITAALLLLIVTYALFESSVVVSPIWSEYGNIQLKQKGYDVLRALDVHRTSLDQSKCPDLANVSKNSIQYMLIQLNRSNITVNEEFENALNAMLDPSVKKRMEIYWINQSNNNTLENLVLINNTPIPDAVAVSRVIVLYPCEVTPQSPFNESVDEDPLAVEVRMVLWYV